ncbi:glycosyltransferase [Pseudonocardia eucalypti]|uniref:Glycosyltransferase n=1 Tax=Pseudonocardia eucalypti TaxID=648755 RepID=A0ABP9QXZ6_9PSEU|nr:galactofuranosylgalactofuranosylrhamnosyl-N-acetylglucosaminyl-diphospho-decaprenol beta-1,5/1,6-galactofuranosyltransferase [Pseudonocardia eucalypti]
MTDLAEHTATPNGSGTSGGTGRKRRTPTKTEPKAVARGIEWDGPGALLQRVILPRTGDPLDLRALYLDEDEGNRKRAAADGRTTLRVPAQSEISFATYFNAFPASYWRRWTSLEGVQLRLATEGECRVDIYRSKADGTQIHVTGGVLGGDTESVQQAVYDLDLGPFEDGGWYWFDLTSHDEPVTLHEASWYAPVNAPGRAKVAIGITTFNRPTDCVGALAALGEDQKVLDVLGAVTVADQGNRKIRDEAGFEAAAAVLGDRLNVVDQPNLGGSGGFSRGMHEALTNTDCDQILLMDDDIVIEPDSVLRAVAFSRFTEQPTLVGGQMLNLQARSHLHTMGEVVDRYKFKWGPAPHVEHDHDFAKYPLRHATKSKDLHRRIDVDYNGWWMCLIPRTVAEKLGLPLPLFIKWDDTEYGLRAGRAGFPTATLPGVAIWHMPWSDKDDATDWQAYFHLRNRLVVAALHSPYRRGGALLMDSMKNTLKHLMSLEYSTVALQELAMHDFCEGPMALFDALPTALGEVRKKRAEFDDGRVLSSAKELPLPSMDRVRASRFLKPPTNPITIGATLISGLIHNIMPAQEEHHRRPQLNVAAQDARWFLMARLDGATVGTADGRGVAYRKRDPKVFWSLLRTAVGNHIRLARAFPRMRRTYRNSLPELTGSRYWVRAYHG